MSTFPSELSWHASIRAARAHFAATSLAAFFLRSCNTRWKTMTQLQMILEVTNEQIFNLYSDISASQHDYQWLSHALPFYMFCISYHTYYTGIFFILTGGVSCTIGEWYIKPVCGMMAAVEKPDRVFFCAPTRSMLHAGILDRFVNPPATPTRPNKSFFKQCRTTKLNLVSYS